MTGEPAAECDVANAADRCPARSEGATGELEAPLPDVRSDATHGPKQLIDVRPRHAETLAEVVHAQSLVHQIVGHIGPHPANLRSPDGSIRRLDIALAKSTKPGSDEVHDRGDDIRSLGLR